MIDSNSLPSVEQSNLDRYWDIVRRLDPEFYLIKLSLQETGVNPSFLPKIIRAINNLAMGTGYGKVQVFISNKRVTQIKNEESDQVEQDVLIDKT